MNDDEHVVDADSEKEERESVVHRAEEESDSRTKPVGDKNAHRNASESGGCKVGPAFDEAELSKSGQDVDHQQKVAGHREPQVFGDV